MGLIQAPPAEMVRAGAAIEGLGTPISTLTCMAGGMGSGVSEPFATAAALERLGTRWSQGSQRLQDELVALGRAVEASAIAYQVTDQSAMGTGS